MTVDVVVGDELVLLPDAGERGTDGPAPEEGADDVAAVRRCVVLFISFIYPIYP